MQKGQEAQSESLAEKKERDFEKWEREAWLEGRRDAFDGTRPGRFRHGRRPR